MLAGLVVLDIADDATRHWFTAHAFTTDALVAVLVLLITVLNVDRIQQRRRMRENAQVTAAQAAIVARQAQRSLQVVRDAIADPDQREAASDEVRTYMAMLLVSAPILIDVPPARRFLESAQRLGGLLSQALAHADDGRRDLTPRLDAAADAVRETVMPLVSVLDHAQRRAVESDDDDVSQSPA